MLHRFTNISEIELQSAFDPASLPAYLAFGTLTSAALAWCLYFSFTFSAYILIPLVMMCSFIAVGTQLRRLGLARTSTVIEAIGLVYGQSLAGFLLVVPAAAVGQHFADASLVAADALFGFNWAHIAGMLSPWHAPLQHLYRSMIWQPVLVLTVLAVTRREADCWKMVTAGSLAMFVTTPIFAALPAVGGFAYFHLPPSAFGGLTYDSSPFNFVPTLHKLRDGYRIIDASLAGGLVTFPSYHLVCATIFCAATWPLRLIRLPMILLNAGLGVSAIYFGPHYLVDIIAGSAIGLASFWCAHKLVDQAQTMRPYEKVRTSLADQPV